MKKILLGVTGSVAAKLTPKLVSMLLESGYEVKIAATQASLHFWKQESVSVPVYLDADEWPEEGYADGKPIMHIELREWADMFLIAPVTANTLAKMAHGISDNLLTSVVRAWNLEKPILIAPAMNTQMWENPLTGKHIDVIAETYDMTLVHPVEKLLACGKYGMGAIADLSTIRETVRERFLNQ
ncbi:MAG: phosphopantothenoylcysteine decarboxylase [Candidatus Moranbacteria bacterium]|nr:phosphopantothenoylcysteine decarboxylase [Candidatus Moranbacteria bacterium]